MSTSLRVGINGFGRIGRAFARILLERDGHRVVHINDVNTDVANLAYLLKYDTTYGRLDDEIRADGDVLVVDDRKIRVTHADDIADVPWSASEVDVVIEATGVELNERHARAIAPSLRSVLVTHTCKQPDEILVFGATQPRTLESKVVSTSICDAVAVAPIVKRLHERFGLAAGFITTLHPWLSYQNLMDGPSRSQATPGTTHSHYPLGRASISALIPKPTTVVAACEQMLPEISGVLQCMSFRVPTASVASADLSLCLDRPATAAAILDELRALQAEQGGRKIVRISDEPLVSIDYLGDEHSCIVDTRWLMVHRERHVKLVLWYDNEWGYASRVADAIDLVAAA